MQTFGLKDEHIKLGQLLKATGLVGSGVSLAKLVNTNSPICPSGTGSKVSGSTISGIK